jgi:hypothetical protein
MATDNRYRQEIQILRDYSNSSGTIEQYELLFHRVKKSIEQIDVINEESEEAPIIPVRFMKLVYFKETPEFPFTSSDKWKILGLILKTRGLSRWLSFNFFSSHIKELERSYFLSRIALFRIMLKNKEIIQKQIGQHIRYLSDLEDIDNVPTVTQNDYFRAISGVKMILPDVSILSTHDNFQIDVKAMAKRTSEMEQAPSDLIPRLMKHNAKSFLLLLLEFNISEELLQYIKRTYLDAHTYLDTHVALKTVRLARADLTFDEIAIEQNFELTGEVVDDVEVWHQRFLVKGNSLLEFDVAGSHRLPFVAGHWQYTVASEVESDKVFIQTPLVTEKEIGEAIFLSNRADENWFHLLLDTLPRYLFLKDLPDKIPVLIRGDLPVTTKEFLYKILNRPIIELPSNSRVRVRKLHLLAARSTCFDTINEEVDVQVKFSPAVLKLLVEWIKISLDISRIPAASTRAYFRRSSRQRRAINFQKIERVAESRGLNVIEDNEVLYRNQVEIFSGLKLAVIPGGAMLANMIFMKPGGAILCLRGSRQNDLELWRKLADAVGLNSFEVVGPATYYGRNALQRDHSNYYIFPTKFLRTLSAVMHSNT